MELVPIKKVFIIRLNHLPLKKNLDVPTIHIKKRYLKKS